MYLSCGQIVGVRPEAAEVRCCESCHIDYEEFGYDLCFVDNPLDEDHSGGVCCAMSIYLGENPLTIEEWKSLKENS